MTRVTGQVTATAPRAAAVIACKASGHGYRMGGKWATSRGAGVVDVRIPWVNNPMAKARGLRLRSKVPRCLQGEPHAAMPLPGSHREAGCLSEWGSPARQRTRGTHYTPAPGKGQELASRCRQRWARRSRLLRVIVLCSLGVGKTGNEIVPERGSAASSPSLKAGVSAAHI